MRSGLHPIVLALLLPLLSGCLLLRGFHRLEERLPYVDSASGRPVTVWHAADEPAWAVEMVRDGIERGLVEAGRWGGLRDPLHVRVYPDLDAFLWSIGRSGYRWLRGWAVYDTIHLVSPRAWGEAAGDRFARFMVHELAHVLMYQNMAERTDWYLRAVPVWFREGFASYTAGQAAQRMSPEQLAAWFAARPDGGRDFVRNTGAYYREFPGPAYSFGHHAFAALIETHGEQAVVRCLGLMRRHRGFSRSFRLAFGRGEREWIDTWRDRQVGGLQRDVGTTEQEETR